MNPDSQNVLSPVTQAPPGSDTQHPGATPESATSSLVTPAFQPGEPDVTPRDRTTSTPASYPSAFARYQIIEPLAEGGMGVVYKARSRVSRWLAILAWPRFWVLGRS